MRQRIVLDTDIGTDVDDAFALVYLLKNPNADVLGISTVIGDPVIRAKIVKKLEKIIGIEIPIIAGQSGSEDSVKKYWTGIERLALTDEELKEPFINNPFPEYSPDTRLVCIGPLTNVSLQLKRYPSIKNIREIYVMGSTDSSHNFKADLEAKTKVFREPWNIYQITKQVSEQISFTRKELEQIRETPLGQFLYESAIRWLDHTKRDKAIMYDVLTVSASLSEPYVKFEEKEKGRF